MIRTLITAASLLLACALQHQGRGFAATVSSTADAGPGSLRAAIAAAAPGETITFSITGAVTLTSSELQISKNVRIAGPGASLVAIERRPDAPPFRIFNVMSSANTSLISGVTIRNGAGNANQDSGAGIQNNGRLAVTDCAIFIW